MLFIVPSDMLYPRSFNFLNISMDVVIPQKSWNDTFHLVIYFLPLSHFSFVR